MATDTVAKADTTMMNPIMVLLSFTIFLLLSMSTTVEAFSPSATTTSTKRRNRSSNSNNNNNNNNNNGRSTTALFDGDGTGGWGIGGSRQMTPEEFVKGDRRYFDGYKMSQQSDFISKIKEEKDALKRSELDELLGVAKIAGINVKNPKDRLNKFEDSALLDDDEDDIDLSV